MYRVLTAYDEERARHALPHVIGWEALGLEPSAFTGDGREAFRLYGSLKPDLVISDLTLPSMGGLEMLCRIKKADSSVRFIGVSSSKEASALALKLGADTVLPKPSGKKALSEALQAVINSMREEEERQLALERSTIYARAMLLSLLYAEGSGAFIRCFRPELRRGFNAVLLSAEDMCAQPELRQLLPPLSFSGRTVFLCLSKGKHTAKEPFRLSYQGSAEEALKILSRTLSSSPRVYIQGDEPSELVASAQYLRRLRMLYGNLIEAWQQGEDLGPVLRCLSKEEASDVLMQFALWKETSGNRKLAETSGAIRKARHPEELLPCFSRLLSESPPYSVSREMKESGGLSLETLSRKRLFMDPGYLSELFQEETGQSYESWLSCDN